MTEINGYLPLPLIILALADRIEEVIPNFVLASPVVVQHYEQFLVREKRLFRSLQLTANVFGVFETCSHN